MDENADYVTVLPTSNPRRFLACVMRYHKRDDEYVQARVSQVLSATAARSLAEMWSAALGLEIR